MEIQVKNSSRLNARLNANKKEILEMLNNALFNINELMEIVEDVESIETLREIWESVDKMEDYLLNALDLI